MDVNTTIHRSLFHTCSCTGRLVGNRSIHIVLVALVTDGGLGSCPQLWVKAREIVVKRISDRMMFIKLVIGRLFVNVVSAYTPDVGLDEEVKRLFWEDLDEVVRGIPSTKKIFIGGDFNGHIGTTSNGFDDVHGGFGFRERNGGGVSLLEFAKAFELVIANSCF
ncbi:uncharacterized protein LOC129869791 [Solanum dulcamara]|uniref:uncharacterized protein LOC129869791 n=1 Tax=Solanum dulcamara TaxID=45834 RepID=UPI002485BB92|nr:uncharacterized protein LOC129869791 [Solanum dulcamara]